MDQSITQTNHKSANSGRAGLIIFGLVFTVAGVLFSVAFLGPPLVGAVRSRNWVATPCVIVASRVEESSGGDDGPTYRVAASYRYVWDDREHLGERYSWSKTYSSGRVGKQKIVNHLWPGSETTCYVNPANPAESVLNRGVGWETAFGLIPLVFVIVGITIVFFALRSKSKAISDAAAGRGGPMPRGFASAGRTANGWVAIVPIPDHDRGPRELRPERSSGKSLVVLAIFAVIWNGFVGGFLWFGILGSGRTGAFDVCGAVFMIPFVLVGLAIIVGVIYSLLALRNPRPTITLSKSIIRLGDSMEVRWKVAGRTDRISVLNLTLEGREIATYQRGTSTYTDKHVFAKVDIAHITRPMDIASGRATLRVPESSMPSFQSANNRIQWALIIHGDIPYWPDMKEEFSIDIYGPDTKVVLDGPAD